MKKYRRVLTIAGSDSGGGAGVQADLKTFSVLGCYGMSVITALTAQNTREVTGIFPVDPDFVLSQLDAVLTDIGVDAVKIGMLDSPEIIRVVAERLKSADIENIVLDPVMIAKSGDKLLRDEAVSALKEELVPLSKILTPNVPEAEVLTCMPIEDPDDMQEAGFRLLSLGTGAVVLKGGHMKGRESSDCLLQPDDRVRWFDTDRIDSRNTHGTGCTLSSAITSFLARGCSTEEAVGEAKNYIQGAISAGAGYRIGRGCGPVHHFFRNWRD